MKLKFIIIIICLFTSTITFSQQLFGHVDLEAILMAMPEMATAQLQLQAEQGDVAGLIWLLQNTALKLMA